MTRKTLGRLEPVELRDIWCFRHQVLVKRA